MAVFDYQALTAEGSTRKGSTEADSARQARQQLRDQGLVPLQIEEAAEKHQGRKFSLAGLKLNAPTLNARELALITRQMATLIQSSLPLEESLAAIAQQSESARVKSLMLAVRSKVLEGHSLADSLGEFPRAFPKLYRATVAAGEHSGHLDKVMNRLADHTETSHAFRQKVQMAMVYPILLLIMAVAIVTGLMVYVVPDVIKVFVGTGQELPALTRGLVAISDFIGSWGWLMIPVLILAGMGVNALLRKPHLRLRFHRQLLHWPFIKRLTRGFNAARYASTLSILTSSGVPLVEGMKIATEVLSNEYLKDKLHTATQQVTEGGSLHQALGDTGYFPPMMLHMVASGETSGELDSMLERTATHQETDLQNFITVVVGLFEPLMLVFMGVTVMLIVMAILLPILNMNQLVG
jgi:general secretion pathway protein F